MSDREEYLYDGLYVSFDGFGYKLRASRDGIDHWVYLEDRTLEAFDRYRKEVEGRIAEREKELIDGDRCTNPGGHSFVCSGTAYGGDDESYHGEGRCYCEFCGADGDA